MKHHSGSIRSHGINMGLLGVSIFFKTIFEGGGVKRNVSIGSSHQKIIETKFKVNLLKMMYHLRLSV